MKTRLLMSASAVLLGAVGIALSFLPQELLAAGLSVLFAVWFAGALFTHPAPLG